MPCLRLQKCRLNKAPFECPQCSHTKYLHSPDGLQRMKQLSEEAQMQFNAKQYAEHLQSNARVRKLIGHVAGKEHEFVQV